MFVIRYRKGGRPGAVPQHPLVTDELSRWPAPSCFPDANHTRSLGKVNRTWTGGDRTWP